MRALLVYPTHKNCAEVQAEAVAEGLDAAVYPGRCTGSREPTEVGKLLDDGGSEEPNCWNTDADDAESIGFPVVKTVCPTCPCQRRCRKEGYLQQLAEVQKADVAICTHKRVEYSAFAEFCAGRQYISVHENPIDLLRPQCGGSVADLLLMESLLKRLLNDPRSLDWFGNAARMDDEGNEYQSEEGALRRDRLYEFCHRIADVVDDLLRRIEQADQLTEWPIPEVLARPQGIERLLFQTSRRLGINFSGQPWRFVLSAAAGELQSAAILVRSTKDGPALKSVIGFRSNPPARSSITWFDKVTGAKLLRAQPFADQCEAGNVRLVNGAWNFAFVEELCVFPAGDHDDQVDAAAGAFSWCLRTPRFETPSTLSRRFDPSRYGILFQRSQGGAPVDLVPGIRRRNEGPKST